MIYKRQRILLKILLEKRPKVSKIQLMKWLFLLRQETDISEINGFYDFVPYDYGPFSFTVYKDLVEMQRLGLIGQDEKFVWGEWEVVGKEVTRLPKRILNTIADTMDKYGDMGQNQLIDYVYKSYPWYATKSRIRLTSNLRSHSNPAAIYTIGYEDLTIDSFLDTILLAGMETVIDVRNNPISRKYGFSKTTLLRLCDKFGIQYLHFPQLGIPSSYRANIDSYDEFDYRKLWDLYEKDILNLQPDAIDDVIEIIQNRPSAILCFEKDPEKCHRNRLSTVISKETGLEIVHLRKQD